MPESQIAIVGRPNVGKSSLMNKILGQRKAITEKTSGITRDIRKEPAHWRGWDFLLLDTGGWAADAEGMDAAISELAMQAARESDLLLFVVDSQIGVTGRDVEMANAILRLDMPVILVANKVDDPVHEVRIWDFMSLGTGDPYPVSALHGKGVADVLDLAAELLGGFEEPADLLEQDLAPAQSTDESENSISVAIVGRPNAGKSTLFNKLVGSQRSIESPVPGTTRDPVDTLVDTEIGLVRFVDTAGMRRRAKGAEPAEYYAALRALESVDRSDIALLIIDASEAVTQQDQRLGERIDGAGCPILVILNKWDLCNEEQKEILSGQVSRRLQFLANSPLIRISALSGAGINKIYPALQATVETYHKRVPTRQVNDLIIKAQSLHSPPGGAKVLYAAQVAADPPTFTFFVNRKLPPTYLRYLERKLREELEYGNAPLKIRVRLKR